MKPLMEVKVVLVVEEVIDWKVNSVFVCAQNNEFNGVFVLTFRGASEH